MIELLSIICILSIVCTFLNATVFTWIYIQSLKRKYPETWSELGKPSPYLPGSLGHYIVFKDVALANFRKNRPSKTVEIFRIFYVAGPSLMVLTLLVLVVIGTIS